MSTPVSERLSTAVCTTCLHPSLAPHFANWTQISNGWIDDRLGLGQIDVSPES